MYLVLSAFTSSPISLVATTRASAFSFTVCVLPPSILTSYILIIIAVYLILIVTCYSSYTKARRVYLKNGGTVRSIDFFTFYGVTVNVLLIALPSRLRPQATTVSRASQVVELCGSPHQMTLRPKDQLVF